MSKQSITVASKDFDGAARIASKLENAQSLKNRRNSHRVEFDSKAFEILALNYEAQTFQMAKSLDDRLYRSLALAAIYRGKSNRSGKNYDEKRGQLKFFARPPRSKRSISDKQLVPCDDY